MRCAIYCRLSREDEDKLSESESIQNQKSLLVQYATEQQWDITSIYCDEDYSGADRNRPDFKHMIRDAQKRKFDLILCKTQSRFTRDIELVERYIHTLFPLWGIRFVAIADHIDTSLHGNKKARQINGLVNEWYLEDLSENIRMVLDHKRRNGLYIGGFPLYGYQKHPSEKGHLMIDPSAASVVQQIFRWAQEGHGKQKIADLLNQSGIPNPSRYKQEQGLGYVNGSMTDPRGFWSRSSVGRILRNEMYLGTMVQGTHRKLSYKSKKLLSVPKDEWFRVEGTHEAIIDGKTFHAVQHLHKLRSKTDGIGKIHPLAGLVKCMSCGSTMQKNSYTYRGERYCYLRCPSKECKEVQRNTSTCSIRLEALILLVESQIRIHIHNWYSPATVSPEQLQIINFQKENGVKQRLSVLTARLTQRISALESLYLDKVSGLLTPQQFRELSEVLSQEIESLRLTKASLEEGLYRTSSTNDHSAFPKKIIESLMCHSIPRALLLQLISKIEVERKNTETGRQNVRIDWKF
jgi:DNA invertase Pin-like site-specific DNA recombinase